LKERFNIIGLLLIFVFLPLSLRATHNRAGEITYKQISDLTYRITVITYTSTGPEPVADRPELEVQFGDGTKATVKRIEEVFLPNYYKRNKYVYDHTYPGPGTYQILMEDPNRNRGVVNIPNSVNVVFSIKSILIINPAIGQNSTPVLLNPPIDKAALGYTFIHNPAAFDPDGDSLSYKLAICTAESGKEIVDYTYPSFSDSLVVNERTGDLIWATPTQIGKYNVAMTIEEWRNGVRIGRIQRDMQIEVYETTNKPPVISGVGRFCIIAGQTFSKEIRATDPNNDSVRFQVSGGPFSLDLNPAIFKQVVTMPGLAIGNINWKTDCTLVRKQPYLMIIKAKDLNGQLQLIDSKNIEVYIQAPPVKNLKALPASSFVTVSWDPSDCANAAGYRIYRKTGSASYTLDTCRTGIPPELGYQLAGEVAGHTNSTFIDSNNGLGLNQATDYCYRVIAFFNDGAESLASEEVCTQLVRGFPLLVKVSVAKTDAASGEMDLAWLKPTAEQISGAPGPFVYRIFRSPGLYAQNLVLIDSVMNLDNTIYKDKNINTLSARWSYQIELWNTQPGNRFRIGIPQMASAVFLELGAFHESMKLSFEKNVPWVNDRYVIYRNAGVQEDSVGQTADLNYNDRGLREGVSYCYRVKSIGGFPDLSLSGLVNWSQTVCAIPIDTIAPCAPILMVTSVCDSLGNKLTWNNVNDSCCTDAAKYRIYYRNTAEGDLIRIDSLAPADKTVFWHFPDKTMAGCYAVTAVDSVGNESIKSNIVCVDDCINYSIPNVFTPNGDGMNDWLKPNPYNRVEKIDLKVYSRWNTLVFKTENPDINWDGKNYINGKQVPSGVYYYVCTVYERRLTGVEPRVLTGFVHILYSDVKN
jgi:gliding motility-associated-like protein